MRAENAAAAAETAARASYGRLVAYLAARSRDIAAAEDALSEAFRAALETWPRDGVPRNPEAWLLTAARRRLIDAGRRHRVHEAASHELARAAEEAEEAATMPDFPDERLKLLFVCAHPAIDAGARTPLMLQTVLGLDAARIAAAFIVAPSAMSQRLVRAKAKIAAAGLRFATPEADELPARLDAVLQAIYAAYGTGWDDPTGPRMDLAGEAIYLARLVVTLQPDRAEALGLLALMLHCEARKSARRHGPRYVPLSEQDTSLWSRTLIREAEGHLLAASRLGDPGRFQLEAAIQSVHAGRMVTGATRWEVILELYDALLRIAPTMGAAIGRAGALIEAGRSDAALAVLAELPDKDIANYQPYWATRAHALSRCGRKAEAEAAYLRAAGLTDDPAVRAFLLERMRTPG